MNCLIRRLLLAVALSSGLSTVMYADEPTDQLDLRLEFGPLYQTTNHTAFVQNKQKTFWGTALYRVTPSVKLGLEVGQLFREKGSADLGLFQVRTTSRVSSLYVGPVAQVETTPGAFTLYARGGAGILKTALHNRTDITSGGGTDSLIIRTSFLSPAITMAIGADYHVNKTISIGLGLRDLWVFEKGFKAENTTNGVDSQTTVRDVYRARHNLMPFIGVGFHF